MVRKDRLVDFFFFFFFFFPLLLYLFGSVHPIQGVEIEGTEQGLQPKPDYFLLISFDPHLCQTGCLNVILVGSGVQNKI